MRRSREDRSGDDLPAAVVPTPVSGGRSVVLAYRSARLPSAFGFRVRAISISVLWFFLAVLLLDSFDISLPRGDSIGVSGAVSAAASSCCLGRLGRSVICIGSVLVTHLARHGTEKRRRVIGALFARSSALAAARPGLLGADRLSPTGYHGLLAAALVPLRLLDDGTRCVHSSWLLSAPDVRSAVCSRQHPDAGPLLLAQWSASVLLLITYNGMGPWSPTAFTTAWERTA